MIETILIATVIGLASVIFIIILIGAILAIKKETHKNRVIITVPYKNKSKDDDIVKENDVKSEILKEEVVNPVVEENNVNDVEVEQEITIEEIKKEIDEGIIPQGQGFVVGVDRGIVAGEYIVESNDGEEPFKVRTGRNVKVCNNGDVIELLDKQKVTPISASIKLTLKSE